MTCKVLDLTAELEKRRAINDLQKKAKVLAEKIRREVRGQHKGGSNEEISGDS